MDDVIRAKVSTIERCLSRIEEESKKDWKENYTNQDALLLNLERASQATIDCATHIIRKKKLGIPSVTREVFTLLEEAQVIEPALAESLRKMVGFRNLAVHDYANLNLNILQSILDNELDVFSDFCRVVLKMKNL